jgi:hypothetical protein
MLAARAAQQQPPRCGAGYHKFNHPRLKKYKKKYKRFKRKVLSLSIYLLTTKPSTTANEGRVHCGLFSYFKGEKKLTHSKKGIA